LPLLKFQPSYDIVFYYIMLVLLLSHKFKSAAFLCRPLANVWCQVSWKFIRCFKIWDRRPPPYTHTHTHTHTQTPTQNDDVSLLPKIVVCVRERCYITGVFQFCCSHDFTE